MTTGINLLDIAIPIILLLYFLAGVRSGFFTTLGTFLGLGLGVCAAAWLVPLAVASVGSRWSLITAVGVLVICLTIGQWLGLVAGRTIRRVTDITPLKGVERF
ncbi:CvpA family protein, partial [uncultured Rothia sp.]